MIMYGQTQQFGAYIQPSLFRCVIIDLKMNLVVLNNEINHATGLDELIYFTHRQYTFAAQTFQNFRQLAIFRWANEQNLAIRRLLD